jgi:hypothetical protein
MEVNVPQESVNAWDVWRTQIGWSTVFSPKAMSPGGSFLNECWPTPFQAQTFPFEAYQQPPDLVLDGDAPVPWIASDLIVTRAVADALVYRGPRINKYYDATTSMSKKAEYKERIEEMELTDNDMDQRDVTWSYGEEMGGYGPGSTWQQSHA